MSELYTVEPFSTYRGIRIEENEFEEYINLANSKEDLIESNMIFLDKVNKPKSSFTKLGMIKFSIIEDGVFQRISKFKFIVKDSKQGDKSRIIFSSYKKFKVLKGDAEYLFVPSKNHKYALIRVFGRFVLELQNETGSTKQLSFINLR